MDFVPSPTVYVNVRHYRQFSTGVNTSGILTSLGATSIDAFELIVSVEERFGFEFDDQELNPDLVDPLGRLVTSVCQKIGVDT